MKLNEQKEEWRSIRIMMCTILPLYLSICRCNKIVLIVIGKSYKICNSQLRLTCLYFSTILGALVKLRIGTISLFMSDCPSVRLFVRLNVHMVKLKCYWTDLHEIWYLRKYMFTIVCIMSTMLGSFFLPDTLVNTYTLYWILRSIVYCTQSSTWPLKCTPLPSLWNTIT